MWAFALVMALGCMLDRQGAAPEGSGVTSSAMTVGEGPMASSVQTIGAGGSNAGGAGGVGGTAPCPVDMVLIAHPSGDYCIDRTEVTSSQYKLFLDTQPDANAMGPPCDFKTTFVPRSSGNQCTPMHYSPGMLPNRPVACVDWCDAFAYCQWAGKHLCGKIGGGSFDFGQHTDTNVSEWFYACSTGGTQVFPYGGSYEPLTCVGDDYDMQPGDGGSDEAIDVTAAANCQGGFGGLFDMSGNVWEWENACETGGADQDQRCHDRGGSFWDTQTSLDCEDPGSSNHLRGYFNKNIGFRCCADAS